MSEFAVIRGALEGQSDGLHRRNALAVLDRLEAGVWLSRDEVQEIRQALSERAGFEERGQASALLASRLEDK